MFFRYTRHLEEEIKDLKAALRDLHQQNEKLLETILLLCKPKITTAGEMAHVVKPPEHVMDKGPRHASCSCGWNCLNDDPGELQQEISAHYRKNLQPSVKAAGRKSWPQIKNVLNKSLEEPPK